jgi:hypothetical protein
MFRVSICLFLLAGHALAQKTGASDEKLVVDSDTNNKDSELPNMELIPRDQLCLLCHSVITKFQQASNKNPEQFKNVSNSWIRLINMTFLGSTYLVRLAKRTDGNQKVSRRNYRRSTG